MTIKSWGFTLEIVEHRPLACIWIEFEDGTREETLASPHPFCQQLINADVVAEELCHAEAYYDGLLASGAFDNLDDVDEACRKKYGALEFTSGPAPRLHD